MFSRRIAIIRWFQAKKLGVFVKINNELLRFASPSAEGLVRLDMARVAALKADVAMLEGTGGTQVVRSSQVSNTRVKGSGTTLTYVLLGYFPDWIVARMGVMEFLASGLGDTALQNDQTYLRGIQHLDAGARHGPSFVLCDQLLVA